MYKPGTLIATDGAPVFVDPEDRVAESRVAFERVTHCYPWHANGVEDVVVVRGLPMSIEELLGDVVGEVGLVAECVVEVCGQAAVGTDLADDGESRVVPVGRVVDVGLESSTLRDLPETVRLQVPERVLGPGSAGWAEVLEETAEFFLNPGKCDQPVFATLECCQGVAEGEAWTPALQFRARCRGPGDGGVETQSSAVIMSTVQTRCRRSLGVA